MQVTTNFGTVKILMLKGEKGDTGNNGYFEQLTEEQKAEIRGDVYVVYEKDEGVFTTTQATTVIPIPVSYSASDMLFVDVEGLSLIEGRDYTIEGTNIILTSPINSVGVVVHFSVLHTLIAPSEDYAKSMQAQIDALEARVKALEG